MVSEQEITAQLDKLVKERDAELQSKAKQRKEEHDKIDKNAKAYLKEVTEELRKQHIDLDSILKLDAKKEKAAKDEVEKNRERLKNARQIHHDGLSLNQSTIFSSRRPEAPLGFPQLLLPYYTKQYHIDAGNAVVDAEGYNIQNLDPWTKTWGDGSGLGAVGYFDPELIVDRWFFFKPDMNRNYSFQIHEPYHGFYIVIADDGFWTSKDAWVKIYGYIQGYQYNWKARSDYNVLYLEGQNINRNERLDDTRNFYYAELFGGNDLAYLLITQFFTPYANGSGSYAELNFGEGDANYLAPPYIYVY